MWQHDKSRIESLLYYLKTEYGIVIDINYRPYTNWKWFVKENAITHKLENVGIEYNTYSKMRIFIEGFVKGVEFNAQNR